MPMPSRIHSVSPLNTTLCFPHSLSLFPSLSPSLFIIFNTFMAAHSFLVAWKDKRVRSLLTAVVWEVESITTYYRKSPDTPHALPTHSQFRREETSSEKRTPRSQVSQKSGKVGLKLQWTKNNCKLSFIICKMSPDIFYSYRRNSFQGMEIPCSKNQIG